MTMRAICLNFQIHQPFRFRRYRFFDIGNDHYYYDDYANETSIRGAVEKCYMPANELLLRLIGKYGSRFKVSFSISGIAMDQFRLYAPEILDSFRNLAATGNVEFLSETYSNSLASLKSKSLFEAQVRKHDEVITSSFGMKPSVFRNSELIYSDQIGEWVAAMGFGGILSDGPRPVLGWKSPNYLYCNALNPRLKVLMRNFQLSDDLSFRFGNREWNEYPLSAEKFVRWMNDNLKDELVNLFLDYQILGIIQPKESGIFEFFEKLPEAVIKATDYVFATPSEVVDRLQPVARINVPHPISWADEERDLTAWLGNEMQQEAFHKLYEFDQRMRLVTDDELQKDWAYLQACDHLRYMSTKFFSGGQISHYENPYENPYEAFINFMNVLSDFELRLNSMVPKDKTEQEIASLTHLLQEKERRIEKYETELKALQQRRKRRKANVSKRKSAIAKSSHKE